jgi:H-NS histone family
MSWQYRKIDLNEVPRRRDEIDVLCDAGKDSWELVTITPNNVAYLKREWADNAPVVEAPATDHEEEKTSAVKVKYRDPGTGDTWTGRGRMATWLKRRKDVGEDIEKYRT